MRVQLDDIRINNLGYDLSNIELRTSIYDQKGEGYRLNSQAVDSSSDNLVILPGSQKDFEFWYEGTQSQTTTPLGDTIDFEFDCSGADLQQMEFTPYLRIGDGSSYETGPLSLNISSSNQAQGTWNISSYNGQLQVGSTITANNTVHLGVRISFF